MSNYKRPLEGDSPTRTTSRSKMPNVNRTPPKNQENKEANDILIRIQDLFQAQDKRMEDLFGKQREETLASEERLKDTVRLWMSKVEAELEQIKGENQDLREANLQLRAQMQMITRRQTQAERDSKKLNFVVSGLDFQTPEEGYAKLQRIIDAQSETKLSVTGQRVITMGEKKKIIGACDNLADKRALMSIKKRLYAESNGEKRPIFLDNDKPFEDREADRAVRLAAKDLKARGKEVRFEGGKLKVDGVWMEFNRETKQLEERNFRKEHQATILERARAKKEAERPGGIPQ